VSIFHFSLMIADGSISESTWLGFQAQVIETRWRHIRIKVED